MLTREFRYVKPDRRLLLHVAQQWDLQPERLLMVGDSFEDVECGNAAGTASCHVAGGGNEKPGANVVAPAGAVPTLSVQSLSELNQLLTASTAEGDAVQGASSSLRLGWPALTPEEQAASTSGTSAAPITRPLIV